VGLVLSVAVVVAAVAGAIFFVVLFDLTGRWKKRRRS
jgi:hypothetical protein